MFAWVVRNPIVEWNNLNMTLADGTIAALTERFDGPVIVREDNTPEATGDFYVTDEIFEYNFED